MKARKFKTKWGAAKRCAMYNRNMDKAAKNVVAYEVGLACMFLPNTFDGFVVYARLMDGRRIVCS